MIDAIDLIFLKHFFQLAIERPRGFEVIPKRLFDDNPPPVAVFLNRKFCQSQLLGDGGKKLGRRGQIKKIVATRTMFAVDLFQVSLEIGIGIRVGETSTHVGKPLGEPFPGAVSRSSAGRKRVS